MKTQNKSILLTQEELKNLIEFADISKKIKHLAPYEIKQAANTLEKIARTSGYNRKKERLRVIK